MLGWRAAAAAVLSVLLLEFASLHASMLACFI
jgi:hypothetical protein